jgi:hypothetical protein
MAALLIGDLTAGTSRHCCAILRFDRDGGAVVQ